MKKITSFDKAICKEIMEGLKPVIEKWVSENYGLKVQFKSGTFAEKDFSTGFVLKAEGVNQNALIMAQSLGYPEIGQKFTANGGKHYKVVNYDFKRSKYPVVAECFEDGKNWFFEPHSLIKLIDRQKATESK